MGTSAMVERVAQAIDAALNDTSLAFTTESPHDTDTIRKCRIADTERAIRCARAAIEAMREPTERMMAAVDCGGEKANWASGRAWAIGYRAMIDAALADDVAANPVINYGKPLSPDGGVSSV